MRVVKGVLARRLALSVVVMLLLGCGQELSDSPAALRAAKSELVIAALTAEYDATTGWEEDLVYTFQVQERLITGQPTLFEGLVDDVFYRNGRTFIRFFLDSSYSALGGYFVFELECGRTMVDTIVTQHAGQAEAWYSRLLDEYAVVANIQEVFKPVLAFSASPFSEYDAEVVIGGSDVFIATGTCIHIAYIGAD